MRRNRSVWYLLLTACLAGSIILFSLIMVGMAPSTSVDPCTTGNENADLSCNSGEDDDAFEIPEPQSPEAYVDDQPGAPDNSGGGGIIYRGVSLAGGHCRDPLGREGEFLPVDNDAEQFIYKGMNVMRVPIRWENIGHLNGSFYQDGEAPFIQKLDRLIENLSALNVTIMLDLYNDLRYDGEFIQINQNYEGSGLSMLWRNLVLRYPGTNMMYAVMTVTTVFLTSDFNRIASIVQAAVTGIRNAELDMAPARGLFQHFLILPLVYMDFQSAYNTRTEAYKNIPLINVERYAVEASINFLGRGINGGTTCETREKFSRYFEPGYQHFKEWVNQTQQRVFVSQVGVPTTSENCRAVLQYFLEQIASFPYNKAKKAGIIGWSAWAGGYPTCGGLTGERTAYYSLAPGYPTNELMWDNAAFEPIFRDTVLFAKYLIEIDKAQPPLLPRRRYVSIFNNLSVPLNLLRGYVPFQVRGSISVLVGRVGYLYSSSNSSTPLHALQTHYAADGYVDSVVFGYSPSEGVYHFTTPRNCIKIVANPSCTILDSKGAPQCYIVNKDPLC